MTGTPLPVLAGKVTKAEDGYLEHTFRQSDLVSFSMCLERGRALYFAAKDAPRTESAAALLGTAAHAGIEGSVNKYIATARWSSQKDMMDAAYDAWHDVYDTALAEDRWTWGSAKPHDTRPHLTRIFQQFIADVAPTLHPVRAELNFDRLLLLEDDVRRIYVSGTMDLLDEHCVIDWKTAGRAYQRWERSRWAIQPTVYSFAAHQMGFKQAHAFRYVVFVKGKEVQTLDIRRGPSDYDWLRRKTTALARHIELHDPAGPWPLLDEGWWCSPDFCNNWMSCKGASYGATKEDPVGSWPK